MNERSLLSRLSTIHLFMLLPWIGIVVAARTPLRDNSFLWHIQAGELQRASGQVLTSDPFSFTFEGAAWRTQSWLADLLYAWLDDRFGLAYVPWMIVLIASVTFVLVGVAAHRRSQSHVATAAVLVGTAWMSVAFLSPRPVLFSYAFLAAVALMLERPRLRWALPALLWVWASVHGSFVLGLGLIVLTGLARRRPFGRDLGASVVAVSLTAHGWGVWQTLWRFAENREALDRITEWAPPKLTNPDLLPFLAFIGLLLWGFSRDALARRDLFVVIPFVAFGLSATRSLFPAVIVLAPYVAAALRRGEAAATADRQGISPAANVIAGLGILVLPFLVVPTWEGLSEERFPVAEAASLTDAPVFHDDVVGGYLIYARPDVPVFVDDRAELYGAEHFSDLVAARNARPAWEEVFEEHGIEQALLRTEDGLVTVLELTGWQTVAEGETYVLMVDAGG